MFAYTQQKLFCVLEVLCALGFGSTNDARALLELTAVRFNCWVKIGTSSAFVVLKEFNNKGHHFCFQRGKPRTPKEHGILLLRKEVTDFHHPTCPINCMPAADTVTFMYRFYF